MRLVFATQEDISSAKIKGDKSLLQTLGSMLAQFSPNFEILPGTSADSGKADLNTYELDPVELVGE